MKKKKMIKLFAMLTIVGVIGVGTNLVSYSDLKEGCYDGSVLTFEEGLDSGEISAEEVLECIEMGGFSQSSVQQLVNDGYLGGYVDRLRSEGWLPANGGGSSETPSSGTSESGNTQNSSNSSSSTNGDNASNGSENGSNASNGNSGNSGNTGSNGNTSNGTSNSGNSTNSSTESIPKPVTEDTTVTGTFVPTEETKVYSDTNKSEVTGTLETGTPVNVTAETSNGMFKVEMKNDDTDNSNVGYIDKKKTVTADEWEAGWTETERVEPTCTEAGHITYVNSIDNTTTKVVDLDALGHTYELTESVEPTCTKAGSNTYTCSVCGDTYTEDVQALGHKEGKWEVTKKAGLFSKGTKTLKCAECGEVLETKEIPQTCPLPLVAIVGIGVGIVAVVAGIVVFIKKKKKNL